MKRNLLVLTLGRSDVQIRENRVGGFTVRETATAEAKGKFLFYKGESTGIEVLANRERGSSMLLAGPRKGGKSLAENYAFFRPAMEFPLIEPLMDHLIRERTPVDQVWFIYTDQTDDFHRKNDTVFFRKILQAFLLEKLPARPAFFSYKCSSPLTDIDHQYAAFSQLKRSPFARPEQVERAMLFPQGGIDQVNQALTLQFIQTFKEKAIIFQKPEDAVVRQLQFPATFLHELNRQKIVRHLELFDFAAAEELMADNTKEKFLCTYIRARLDLDGRRSWDLYNAKKPVLKEYFGEIMLKKKWANNTGIERDFFLVKDLFSLIHFLEVQGRYSEALVRLFTLFENMFGILLAKKLNRPKRFEIDPTIKDLRDTNEKFKLELLSVDLGLVRYLVKKKVSLFNPTRRSDMWSYKYLCATRKVISPVSQKQLETMMETISELADKRNSIVHEMAPISKEGYYALFKDHKAFFGALTRLLEEDPLIPYRKVQKHLLEKFS